MTPLRILSLLPAATEIVAALGLEDALVGRSHECDHPPSIRDRAVCTSARILDASSAEIDRQVRSLVEQGLSIYEVDEARLADLAPDLVLTQAQCRVCAASIDDLERALARLSGVAPRIVSLEPRGLGDVWRDVRAVAAAAGVPERGRALGAELAARLAEVGEAVGPRRAERPSVACLEWLDPMMISGNWVPELVHLAGGQPLFGRAGERSVTIDRDALVEAEPDVVVVMACGFDVDRGRLELAGLQATPEWRALSTSAGSAVRAGRVFVTDGNAFFNRPGPRLVESAEILAELLHGEAIAERLGRSHRGRGFVQLEAG